MQVDPLVYADIHACSLCRLGEIRAAGGLLPTPALPGANYRAGGLAVWLGAPRRDDEQTGRPLSGSVSSAFANLLQRAGLNREDLLVGTLIRCRPPNDRGKDWPEATAACDPWTAKELATYNPAVVVLMGGDAIPAIFGATAKVTGTHGMFQAKDERHPWGSRVYVASYSPFAVIYKRDADSEVAQFIVNDLKAAAQMIEELPFA